MVSSAGDACFGARAGGPRALPIRLQCGENFAAVQFGLALSDSGHAQQFAEVGGPLAAQVFERGVAQHHVRRHARALRHAPPPVFEKRHQLGIRGRRGHSGPVDRDWRRRNLLYRNLDSPRRLGSFPAFLPPGRFRGMRFTPQPFRQIAAHVAHIAALPLGRLSEMKADLVMAAALALHKAPHGVIALPGPLFFRRVV